ncbi:arf-GAP with Rho-GAP domain, ANK repeat and PH domain-containing protein 1-like, partial [Pseudonaja textilis]|uniref:arf-GAP with Rho-GAP domain, ANK repeat and PH domain-containing protein 1-like n=1 Tax=Pseudonaja textilis TaxID=8673 RepID=UPI000EA9A8FC
MAEGPSLALAEWLRTLRLDQYSEAFEQSQLRCLQDCQPLTDESLLRLGVLLPGHRKRILSALAKVFAESPAGGPQLPPRRPIPMKRHIFRTCTSATASQAEQEPKPDLAGPSSKGLPTGWGSEAPVGLPLIPPPIPPRTSCHPPVKFSASFPDFPADVGLDSGLDPSPQPAGERLSPLFLEEGAKPALAPLPPLPAKRHQLESKPPVPLRPPTLPPRVVPQKAKP